jgi:hypothetical protein
MMEETKVNNLVYQINFFSDFNNIVVSAETTMKLFSIFKEFDLLPSTFHEFNPNNNIAIPRPKFSSVNNEWGVLIGTQKVTIEKTKVSNELEPGSINDFVEKALEIFSTFLKEYNTKGFRISLITESFLPEMGPAKLNEIYENWAKPLPFYEGNPPFEWNFRSVGKVNYSISNESEKINVITNLSRVQGHMILNNAPKEFDRVKVDFDINTVAQNNNSRFTLKSVEEFLEQAVNTQSSLISEVEGVISE